MTDKACSWAHAYTQEKEKGITHNVAVSVGWGTRWQVAKECCVDVESAGFKKFLSHVPIPRTCGMKPSQRKKLSRTWGN